MSEYVPVIGIDLGTTNSAVAIYTPEKTVEVIMDGERNTTPSYVHFTAEELIVGQEAR